MEKGSGRGGRIKAGLRPLNSLTHHWLVVVLQGHGDHVEANDEGDEDVQVVAGADRMDEEADRAVGGVIRQALGLFKGSGGTFQRRTEKGRREG